MVTSKSVFLFVETEKKVLLKIAEWITFYISRKCVLGYWVRTGFSQCNHQLWLLVESEFICFFETGKKILLKIAEAGLIVLDYNVRMCLLGNWVHVDSASVNHQFW